MRTIKTISFFVTILVIGLCVSCQVQNRVEPPPVIGFKYIELEDSGLPSQLTKVTFDSTKIRHRQLYQILKDYPFNQWTLEYSDHSNLHIANDSVPILHVGKRDIHIELNKDSDLFRAAALLCQLSSMSNPLSLGTYALSPRFEYRGMHLDVGRHLYEVEDVKRYLDYLFFYGYNRFHWHLTEDQGWRIEIKRYPKLQEIAAFRSETLVGHYNDEPQVYDGKSYGGYYTQAQVSEVVAYAQKLGIEVIPEIELPGHCTAALAAYPELSCDPSKSYKVANKWGVFDDIYCPTEKTFQFLREVFDEIMPLFPSQYIHIGGDEVPKRAWKESSFCQNLMAEKGYQSEAELQSYFIKRIADHLESKGKIIMGWDEILDGPIPEKAVVMSWRGEKGGISAAQMGHDVVMTPSSHCYFDYYQSSRPNEPVAIGGFTPIQKVYDYEPIPAELEAKAHHHILGAQGNVWTEYMPNFQKVEYMALTRMITLSEVFVLAREERNYLNFAQRLEHHIRFWKEQNVNIANHLAEINPELDVVPNQGTIIQHFNTSIPVKIEYLKPESSSWESIEEFPFALSSKGSYYFRSKTSSGLVADSIELAFYPHLGNRAKIQLSEEPHKKYYGFGAASLVNGVKAPLEKYGGSEWLGFDGKDLELTLEFTERTTIQQVDIQLFHAPGQWIYLPQSILIEGSENGKDFEKIAELPQIKGASGANEYHLDIEAKKVDRLSVRIRNYGEIPDGKQGAGHPAWLFVGEIIIK